MTYKQIKWASEHDWFIAYNILSSGSYGVIANDDWVDTDGELHSKTVELTDFKELRIWAGY